MVERWTKRDAFAFFDGAQATNNVWGWSARSSDGNTVVITVWDDELKLENGKRIVDVFGHPRLPLWKDRLGNRDRIRNLQRSLARCDGLLRIVVLTARDTTEEPRSIAQCRPDPSLVMKITRFDPETGEFRIEEIVDLSC